MIKIGLASALFIGGLATVDAQTNALHINAAGNVGINTTSPFAKLHVNSTNSSTTLYLNNNNGSSLISAIPIASLYGIRNYVYANSTTSSKFAHYSYLNSGSSNSTSYGYYNYLFVKDGTSYGQYNIISQSSATTGSNSIYGVRTNISARAGSSYGNYISSNRFGGGGASYGNYIDMNQSSSVNNTSYGLYSRVSNSGTGAKYGIYSTVPTTNANWYAGYFNGNVQITGSLTVASDASKKTNVKAIEGAVSLVQQIDGKSYDFIADGTNNFSTGKQYGFLAQELQRVLPELVKDIEAPGAPEEVTKTELLPVGDDGREENVTTSEFGEGQSENYKSVNYIGLIPILVEAIKEQQIQIERQQQMIDELRSK